MDTRWIEPTAALTGDDVLTPAQVASWREAGYAFVAGLFPAELVAELHAAARATFPAPDTAEAASITDFGSGGRLTFPSRCEPFNAVTLHPRLLVAIAQLLGVESGALRLTQSDLWPKYGRRVHANAPGDNDDQRMHVDYPNHTLVHPPPWTAPEAAELILYLDSVEDCGGATAVVPRQGADDPAYRWPIVDTPGVGELDWINDRGEAEAYLARVRPEIASFRESLYAREQRVRFSPGDVLFYRHDTWHRGTPLTPGHLRLAHNITYRLARAEWISMLHTGWAWSAYGADRFLERLIAGASLAQRAVLGFPQPSSSYWCAETLAAVKARYGVFGMDTTPYQRALESL
jgi:hypothetical protein